MFGKKPSSSTSPKAEYTSPAEKVPSMATLQYWAPACTPQRSLSTALTVGPTAQYCAAKSSWV